MGTLIQAVNDKRVLGYGLQGHRNYLPKGTKRELAAVVKLQAKPCYLVNYLSMLGFWASKLSLEKLDHD
jgi:hypothetical protein